MFVEDADQTTFKSWKPFVTCATILFPPTLSPAAIRQAISKSLVAYYQKYVAEASKKEIKHVLISYDRFPPCGGSQVRFRVLQMYYHEYQCVRVFFRIVFCLSSPSVSLSHYL